MPPSGVRQWPSNLKLPKPENCKGCPWYGDGKGFVPDRYVEGSPLLVLSQNPGADEEAGRQLVGRDEYEPHPHEPLLGKTGWAFNKHFLPLTGFERQQVSLANVYRCRVGGSNELPPLERDEGARKAAMHCQKEYFAPPKSTKLVIAEGVYALWAMTGEGTETHHRLDSWRGYMLPYNPPPRPRKIFNDIYMGGQGPFDILPTFHLSWVARTPWYQPVAQRDWKKASQILAGTWPKPLPFIFDKPPSEWPKVGAFDTEFDPLGRLTRYSLAYRLEGAPGIVLHVVEAGDSTKVPLAPGSNVIMQNLDADLHHLAKIVGTGRDLAVQVDDTMFEHAVLYPDLDHDLNFGGSLYSNLNRWKHLFDTNPRVYSGGDAVGTLEWHEGMQREFKRDPQSEWIYRHRQMPLWPIILKARAKGIPIDKAEANRIVSRLREKADRAKAMATAAVGFPLNLGSPDQVGDWLYRVDKIHLNPISGRQWK